MKWRRVIAPVIVVVVVYMAYYALFRPVEVISREEMIEAIQANDALRNAEKKKFIKRLEDMQEQKGREPTFEEALSILPEKVQKYYRLAAKGNMHEITFYGRVVDQYDNPVSGVRIVLGTGGSFLAGGGTLARVSDERGEFNLKVEGSAVFIQKVSHPSIQFKEPLNDSGQSVGLDFGFSKQDNFTWMDFSSPDNPFILKVWRIEKPAKLIVGKTGILMEPDGRSYTVTFHDDHIRPGIITEVVEGDQAPGHIRLRAYAEPIPDGVRYVDAEVNWWFELEAVNGGVISASDDAYLNLAPEVGYQPQVRVEAFANGREGPREFRGKRYYFKANHGRDYGALKVQFVGVSNTKSHKPGVGLEFKVNPNGSRNLAAEE